MHSYKQNKNNENTLTITNIHNRNCDLRRDSKKTINLTIPKKFFLSCYKNIKTKIARSTYEYNLPIYKSIACLRFD